MNTKTRGITLIEVLVVAAIIAALAALIFAALGPARENSRRATCVSNLHQWGTAFTMYIADYDGIDPQIGLKLTHAQLGLPPISDLVPFMKQYNIYKTAVMNCPDTHYPPGNTRLGPKLISYELHGFSSEGTRPGYESYVAGVGPNMRLVVCTMHNADTDFDHQPSWSTKWIQTIHINQSVVCKEVPAHDFNDP